MPDFEPFVPAGEIHPEFTLRAILLAQCSESYSAASLFMWTSRQTLR